MNTARNSIYLAMFAVAAYLAPVEKAAAATALCKATAAACAGTSVGSLLVCAAAGAEAGVNPVADIVCGDLFAAARGSCLAMGVDCVTEIKPQPSTTIIPSGLIGAAPTGTGTTDVTVGCPGSHRVSRISRYKNSAGATSRFTLICTNGLAYGAGPSPPPSGDTFELGTACASGRMAQGFTAGLTSGNFVSFTMKCDNVTGTDDTNSTIGSGGTAVARLCNEKSYVSGMRAFHSGGRLKGVQFLCRKLPGTP